MEDGLDGSSWTATGGLARNCWGWRACLFIACHAIAIEFSSFYSFRRGGCPVLNDIHEVGVSLEPT